MNNINTVYIEHNSTNYLEQPKSCDASSDIINSFRN